MRRALCLAALAATLISTALPAWAHGIEGVIQSIVIAAVAVGLFGGVIAGALDFHPGHGLMATVGLLIAGELAYVVIDVGATADLSGILGMMVTLVAFAGVIPLVICFFIGFGVSALLRSRFWSGQKKNEPAP